MERALFSVYFLLLKTETTFHRFIYQGISLYFYTMPNKHSNLPSLLLLRFTFRSLGFLIVSISVKIFFPSVILIRAIIVDSVNGHNGKIWMRLLISSWISWMTSWVFSGLSTDVFGFVVSMILFKYIGYNREFKILIAWGAVLSGLIEDLPQLIIQVCIQQL